MNAPDLLGPRRLQELFARHGLRPRKALGQNFVVDPNTIRKVVHVAALESTDRVLEIGAGAGSLTLGLAAAAAHVTAVEVDEGLMPVLREVLAGVSNVDIVQGDALALDLSEMRADKLVANLPYNVATPVVLRVLELAPEIRELVVMTQREVGERLAAAPGTKVYGAPTVVVAALAEARLAAAVSRRAFWPVPNVDSVLVRIRRHEGEPDFSFGDLGSVVRAAFGQRRKSLRNSLAALVGGAAAAEALLESVEIDPRIRAEQLDAAAYLSLTRAIAKN